MGRLSDLLNHVCETGLVVFLSAMAVGVLLEVIFRYLIHLPLFWTEELARYCLVWASLLGAAVALKRGEHIAVRFMMDLFPERLRRLFAVVALLAVLALLAVMTWGGIQLVALTRAQTSPALRIPMAIPYLAVPFGAAVMLLHGIAGLLRLTGEAMPRESGLP